MTERQCPLCHIHAIQSPHGQCANANCPPFEGWPEAKSYAPLSPVEFNKLLGLDPDLTGETSTPDYIDRSRSGDDAYGDVAPIAAPIIREAEPSPAPLVEVETVDGDNPRPDVADHNPAGVPPGLDNDGQRADQKDATGVPSGLLLADSRDLLPKVELTMPAPQPIRTLGETLGNILKAATERADKLAQKVQASSDELHKVMDATEEVSQDMDRVTADMKTKLGLGGNGGPAL